MTECNSDGYVDAIAGGYVLGWARGRDKSDPITVSLYYEGSLRELLLADGYRPDLEAAGIGNGRHGFKIPLPCDIMAFNPEKLEVRSEDGTILPRTEDFRRWQLPSNLDLLASPMDGRVGLRHTFELQNTYRRLYEDYERRGVSTTLDPNDKEFGPNENLDHYFSVGADALRLIVDALVSNLREPPKLILDLPSGSGRVTRHLRAFFPEAQIVASDLYDSHVKFCSEQLGTEGLLSREDFDLIYFNRKFDVIFCGSLLTHLPADLFASAIRMFSRALSDTGLAIVTLHGRHSEHRQTIPSLKYVEDRLFQVARSSLPKTGFGYVDYNHAEKAIFSKQARYGITLSRPHWTMSLLEREFDTRILGYAERAWDEHHDVLVFGRPPLNW
jgi:SAM-dependent methyltransferase